MTKRYGPAKTILCLALSAPLTALIGCGGAGQPAGSGRPPTTLPMAATPHDVGIPASDSEHVNAPVPGVGLPHQETAPAVAPAPLPTKPAPLPPAEPIRHALPAPTPPKPTTPPPPVTRSQPAGPDTTPPELMDFSDQADGGLQVFPKDTTKRQMWRIMKEWKRALGMRCTGCHADVIHAERDDHVNKKISRLMQMAVNRANALLKEGQTRMTCWSCHRGKRKIPVLKKRRRTYTRRAPVVEP